MSDNPKICVIGMGNAGSRAVIGAMLKRLDKVMLVDVHEPIVYAIEAWPRIDETMVSIKKEYQHGAYRQFEKRDKRKNFRR